VKKKKATQSEKEYRTLRVAALLSRGVTRSEIIKYTSLIVTGKQARTKRESFYNLLDV